MVTVYEVLIERGQSLCRCGLEEERNRRAVEIPTWMVEPAACCRLRVMAVPTVNCDALELKVLLRAAQSRTPSGPWRCENQALGAIIL